MKTDTNLTVLPLIIAKDIEVSWPHNLYRDYPGNYDRACRTCRADLRLTHEMQVSPFLDRSPYSVTPAEIEVERLAVTRVLRKIYPKELTQELREIQQELYMRSRSYHEHADVIDRLAVVIRQLDNRP